MHVRRGYRIKVVDAEQEVTIGRLKTVAEVHFTDSLQDGMGAYKYIWSVH